MSRRGRQLKVGLLATDIDLPVESFWSRVEKGASCWLWSGPFDWDGYGLLSSPRSAGGRTSWRAHRLSWRIAYGSDPGKMYVCHRCDTPACVNPEHLFLGDAKANFHDCLNKGRYSPKGSGNAAAKLTVQDVRDIRANHALCRVSQEELAIRFGVVQPLVSKIVRRKIWTHI